ncbi:hypothetical protein EON63_00820 [archaeon]|nr:MAG: hypothetical protein EON63_00820 [archaeon]
MVLGTAVTMETFVAWKKNFDDEMAAKKIHKSSAQDEEKLTGRLLQVYYINLLDAYVSFCVYFALFFEICIQ